MTPREPRSPDPLDIELGTAIRLRRTSLGLSQEALGNACGLSVQQIHNFEVGYTRTSVSRLIRIARALGCRASEFVALLESGEPIQPTDKHILDRLSLPGSSELLLAYAQLPPEVRNEALKSLDALARALRAPSARAKGDQSLGSETT